MLHPARTVRTELPLAITADSGDAEIGAELRYDPADPFAVCLAIGVECPDPVVWFFARDLLAEGVQHAAGEGDITIEPIDADGRREVQLTLATNCIAMLSAPREKVMEFLVESFTVVPSGCELDLVDLDTEIEALLAS